MLDFASVSAERPLSFNLAFGLVQAAFTTGSFELALKQFIVVDSIGFI